MILRSFGVGGLPGSDRGGLAEALREWTEHGKLVVMMTQVPYEGSDMNVYQVGQKIKHELNMLEGYDMTMEAVVTKLMWIMGQTRDPDRVRVLFYTPVQNDLVQ